MRNLILRWLFGTDDIEDYMRLLTQRTHCIEEELELMDAHKMTLEREEWALNTLGKLIKVCENHGIDIDEAIKHIQLNDSEVNENENSTTVHS